MYSHLHYRSKILSAHLEKSIWNHNRNPISFTLKLPRHRWELWIKSNIEVCSITKFYLKLYFFVIPPTSMLILIQCYQRVLVYLKFKLKGISFWFQVEISNCDSNIFEWYLRRNYNSNTTSYYRNQGLQ